MYQLLKVVAVLGLVALTSAGEVKKVCDAEQRACAAPVDDTEIPQEWKMMKPTCERAIVDHLKMEFKASITYLALSAYFQGEEHFRPALSKFFLDSAAEEREHAKKLMDYVLMRGLNIRDSRWQEVNTNVGTDLFSGSEKNVLAALKKSLELETLVTNAIREIIVSCESGNDYNDYHTVDYLTGEFLTEQHEGTRQLAGMMTSLQTITRNMNGNHGLAELVFDQTIG